MTDEPFDDVYELHVCCNGCGEVWCKCICGNSSDIDIDEFRVWIYISIMIFTVITALIVTPTGAY